MDSQQEPVDGSVQLKETAVVRAMKEFREKRERREKRKSCIFVVRGLRIDLR